MKHFFTIFLLGIAAPLFAQVGIGTTTPHASAQLEVQSTGKGFLLPRMTEAQRPANAAEGLMIYQTDGDKGVYYYNGTDWDKLVPRSSSPTTSKSTLPAYLYAGLPGLPSFISPILLDPDGIDLVGAPDRAVVVRGGNYLVFFTLTYPLAIISSTVSAQLLVNSAVVVDDSKSTSLFTTTTFTGSLVTSLSPGDQIQLQLTSPFISPVANITDIKISYIRLN